MRLMAGLTGRLVHPAACIVGLLFSILWFGESKGDIYVRKDAQGVLHFTNVPARSGYRAIIRERSKESFSPAPLLPTGFEAMIRSTSERYGVDPNLVEAVMKVESDFNSSARSQKGAQGLMQLMPETARLHNVSNPYDPYENLEGGVRHLKLLLDRFRGDLQLSLAAYNAGIKAVERHGGIPPFPETKEYIRRVLEYFERYHGNGTFSIK